MMITRPDLILITADMTCADATEKDENDPEKSNSWITSWALAQINKNYNNIKAIIEVNPSKYLYKWNLELNVPVAKDNSRMRDLKLDSGATNNDVVLVSMIGTILPKEMKCQKYTKGSRCFKHRDFKHRIVAEGFLGGSCSNCHYNNGGLQCSLRGKDKPDRKPKRADGGNSAPMTPSQLRSQIIIPGHSDTILDMARTQGVRRHDIQNMIDILQSIRDRL
ncbi:hypothetical protein F4824DRAFT_155332 [Ustulina deusta]|nr:hypothetical protein F4824DRAFT_155332 [Ustulina deusta]